MDIQYYRVDKTSYQKEDIQWIKLIEDGKFLLPLKHIRLIYRDTYNRPIREEFILTHCRKYGCMSTIDTKSFYSYAPKKQLKVIILK